MSSLLMPAGGVVERLAFQLPTRRGHSERPALVDNMPRDSDPESLHADEQMRAATQKLRELGWPAAPAADGSGGDVAAAAEDAPDDQGDGVDDRREDRELE